MMNFESESYSSQDIVSKTVLRIITIIIIISRAYEVAINLIISLHLFLCLTLAMTLG